MPVASWGAACADLASYRQPECSQLKDYVQFLMPTFVLRIIISFEFVLDGQIGGVVIPKDLYTFGAGICVERIGWVL